MWDLWAGTSTNYFLKIEDYEKVVKFIESLPQVKYIVDKKDDTKIKKIWVEND